MRKTIVSYLYMGLSVIILMMDSCTSDSCYEDTASLVKATFYKTGSTSPNAPDSITIFGIGMESDKLYSKAQRVSVIKLPLDASAGTCGFIMKINNLTDTVRFNYSSYPHLISKECGISFFHTLESYSAGGAIIDTIIFRNNNITTSNEENISIFY